MADIVMDVSRYYNSIKHWWVYLALGVIFFIAGDVVFITPRERYLALSVVFGLIIMLSGISEIYIGANTPLRSGKGWLLAAGVIEILLGIALLGLPVIAMLLFPFFLGFWVMFKAYTTIGVASDMMGYGIKGAGWTLGFSILAVICSFLVITSPFVMLGFVFIWLGVSLLFVGSALILYSMQLRKMKRVMEEQR